MATGWERLAVFEGGSVSDLARAQAADGSWHVFAATPVGVFCSVDRGRTWGRLGTGNRVAGAEVVAASPRYAEEGLVYAGAHDGVYRYQGDGPSWQRILTDCYVQDIEMHDGDPDARADGSGLTGSSERRMMASWSAAMAARRGLARTSACWTCASRISRSRPPSRRIIAFAATADGLYRTRNGGEAWRQVDVDGRTILRCGCRLPGFR